MTVDDASYGELLDRLRRDLQLDAATDLLPGTLTAALVTNAADTTKNLVDLASRATALTNLGVVFGTASLTTLAGHATVQGSVAHGLGRIPSLAGFPNLHFEGVIKQWKAADVTNIYPQVDVLTVPDTGGSVTSFTVAGSWGFDWFVIG